jgi:GNAT superfamily N-acetyltransferase
MNKFEIPIRLTGEYFLESARDMAAFSAFLTKFHPVWFNSNLDFLIPAMLDAEEKESLKKLRYPVQNELYLLITYQGETVGWFTGHQHDQESFYMMNSVVHPDHRKKGIYTALLKVILGWAKGEGFQHVKSRHKAANNEVIVPKLKAGFIISGMEISDRFGTLVNLTFHFNEKRRMAVKFWSGQVPFSLMQPYCKS